MRSMAPCKRQCKIPRDGKPPRWRKRHRRRRKAGLTPPSLQRTLERLLVLLSQCFLDIDRGILTHVAPQV